MTTLPTAGATASRFRKPRWVWLTGVQTPTVALAVAATYVVGFRAAMARNPLDATLRAADPGVDLLTALEHEPEEAAAAVWHAPPERLADITTTLATRASVHRDADLVKYTLACLDAAAWIASTPACTCRPRQISTAGGRRPIRHRPTLTGRRATPAAAVASA